MSTADTGPNNSAIILSCTVTFLSTPHPLAVTSASQPIALVSSLSPHHNLHTLAFRTAIDTPVHPLIYSDPARIHCRCLPSLAMAPKRRSAAPVASTDESDSTTQTTITTSTTTKPSAPTPNKPAHIASDDSPVSPSAADIAHLATSAANHSEPARRLPRRFKLLRSLALADFITLSNAACGILSIFSCLNFLINSHYQPYILASFILLPLALVFDIADGSVARWRKSSSPYGKDLDSLADVVSFSVAPSVLAFTLGCRGTFDMAVLSIFVCCGIGRLARFNVTALALSGGASGSGKVKYYEGFPVPTSVLLVGLMGVMYGQGWVLDELLWGEWVVNVLGVRLGVFHPFSLLFLFVGSMEISTLKIPKP